MCWLRLYTYDDFCADAAQGVPAPVPASPAARPAAAAQLRVEASAQLTQHHNMLPPPNWRLEYLDPPGQPALGSAAAANLMSYSS